MTLENTLLCGDCRELTPKIESDSVHLILSDIPYGIGADDWDVLHNNTNGAYLGASPAQAKAGAVFKKRGKPLNGWSKADKEIPKQYYDWATSWAGEWLRILKPGGSAIVFAGRRLAHRCICAFEDVGFTYKDMLAWEKERAPHRAQRISVVFERRGDSATAEKWAGWRVGNLQPLFEPILWFVKPYKIGGTIADSVLNNEVGAYNAEAFERRFHSQANLISAPRSSDDVGLHPTQKPLKLMEALVELTTCENHLVVDPFCGSGTTLLAAARLNRRYIGIEIDETYFERAAKRLEDFKKNRERSLFALG